MTDSPILDSPILDSLGMWEATAGLPEQVAAAASDAQAVEVIADGAKITNVVVLGMGGSGISGDVLCAFALERMSVPATVVKSYELPAWVDDRSLVFAVSCSGNTEETISAAESAWSSGATVVAVTSGGTLGAMAERAGSLCIKVPSAIPQPRAALGAMAVPPLIVLEQLGLLPGAAEEISRSVDQLARRRDQLMKPANLAEEVARTIGRTMPLVYGSSGLGSVAAQRWKTQVNENAKSPAFWSAQPELCHNELAGWGQHGDVTRQVMTVVALRQKNEHPQVARRFDFVAEELREVVSEVVDVWAEGEGSLPMFFDLAIFGDFVSLNLAANEGIDPGPIPALDQIKERLSQPS